MNGARTLLLLLIWGVLGAGCAYRPWAGDLKPLDEGQQPLKGMVVEDDGTVTFTEKRLEISLRPLTDDELNRQFSASSQKGNRSTNPFTFGNGKFYRTGETPQRFTVFKLVVKNYEYPKVRVAGDMVVQSRNGRKYYALSLAQLEAYYRSYAVAYRGNEYQEYKERRAILQRTLFPLEDIFSGQVKEGFVVFEPLADDVADITTTVKDIVTRFDFQGNALESTDVSYRFRRDLGRLYPDGRKEIAGKD
ncbi:MAG: hypothetical protein IT369_08785 [Candidatus Latescibacteria bacterium]|nr:hypothetical protein [Candidatus Latescibacterota bacterium]